jgi:adenylyl- and sulfurtransferase ThiI
MKTIVRLISEGKLADAKIMFDQALKNFIQQELEEQRRIVVKVNAKGQRRKKLKCGPGMKAVDGSCKPQTSGEKIQKKKSLRKAVRTKKAQGTALRIKTNKKRARAMKKRKSMGLK